MRKSGIQPEKGPVLISISYYVEQRNCREFIKAIKKLKEVRLRDGGIRWGVYRDSENKDHFVENWILESWGEHVRQHARVTGEDVAIENEVLKLVRKNTKSKISHYIAEDIS